MVVLQLFNREKKAYEIFSEVNAQHMDAYKDAIMAHAVYYPVVEILSSIAVASVIWFGGHGILSGWTVMGLTLDFSAKTLFPIRQIENDASLGVVAAFIQYAQCIFRPFVYMGAKLRLVKW